MLRNYFLINMVIVIMLSFLGFKFYKVAVYSIDIPTEATVEERQKSKDINFKFKGKVPDKKTFQIISNKDLFRPSRTAAVATARPTIRNISNPPKLFATIVRGSNSIAIIEDPGTKKSKPYHINDFVAGYRISEIKEDRVVLLLGEDKIEIKLRDDKGIKTLRPKSTVRERPKKNTRKRTAPVRRTRPPRIPQHNR